MYTVKRAAELVGVSSSTLRAWERRYAAASPQRSKSGYRLYDEQAIQNLKLMSGLIAEGRTTSEAASIVRARGTGLLSIDLGDHGALAEVATSLDPVEIDRVLRNHFAAAPFETVIDQWLMPALVELGEAWRRGEVSVAEEHMTAEAVRRVLATEYDQPLGASQGKPVAIGLPPKSRHELGLLAFAAAARRSGVSTRYLGADVPAASWVRVAESGCGAVVLAVSRRGDLAHLKQVHAGIRAVHPDLPIAVGGALQDRAPADCIRLGHGIGAAAEALAAEVC